MAILTPTRPPRAGDKARSSTRTSFADQASSWLSHPMADVVLVTAPVVLLLAVGSIMVWSASTVYSQTQFGDPFYFMKRQAAFLGVSVVIGYVVSRFPIEVSRKLGWVIFAVAGLLLAVTFIPGVGYGVKGNNNWINIGGSTSMLRLQPAEFAKVAIIVWGAAVMANKRRLLDQPKHLITPFLPFSAILIGLVILQHDLGTALLLSALVLAMLWCVGAPMRVLGVLGAGAAAVVGLLVASGNESRLNRIFGFLNPDTDPTGINQQPMHALYGLATGGWWGVGLGYGRQKWGKLSEAYSDYVLAVIGEELGLIGTLSVLALFVVLGYAGIRIAIRSRTYYGRLVASGVTAWFMIQAVVNVMVVLRLMPVIGVPLPFVSYGGSSLMATMIGLGLLVACARDEPDAKAWLARRSRARKPKRRVSAVLPGRH